MSLFTHWNQKPRDGLVIPVANKGSWGGLSRGEDNGHCDGEQQIWGLLSVDIFQGSLATLFFGLVGQAVLCLMLQWREKDHVLSRRVCCVRMHLVS